MNKKPIYYSQTDRRWSGKPYQAKGERATIGGSGCGPTCAAMLIQTITGKVFTPLDACNWSMAHGFKAPGQGTYYGYFKRQFEAFGVECDRLNFSSLYKNSKSPFHEKAMDMLRKGYYLIACMGPGNWTRGGHYIVVWWQGDKLYINDPASRAKRRTEGDPQQFFSQVKYYWWVSTDKMNGDDDMTEKDIRKIIRDEIQKYEREKAGKPSQMPDILSRAKEIGLTDGTRPRSYTAREECAAMVRAGVNHVLKEFGKDGV